MKIESRELLLFVFIFIAFFVIWAITGGPERKISRGGIFLKPPPPVNSGETYHSWPEGNKNGFPRALTSKTNKEKENTKNGSLTSDFKDKIYIKKYGQEVEENNPQHEYLVIKTDKDNSQGIPITGWNIKNTKNKKNAIIPKGALISKFGSINNKTTIILEPNETAFLITGRSPIGTSFKVNKCSGYLTQFRDFTPNISTNCPNPEDELNHFGNKNKLMNTDIDYINNLNKCVNPITTSVNLSNKAQSFVSKNISYSGCVKNHHNDDNFYNDYWMIYLGKNSELWNEPFEKIYLLDENEKNVDDHSFN